MKYCFRCKLEKELTEFPRSRGTKDGLNCWCKECKYKYNKEYRNNNKDKVRNLALKGKYGITIEEFNSMSLLQNEVCWICKERCDINPTLSVDHYVVEGEIVIRGLLCFKCNAGIGLLKHKEDLLLKAAEYVTEQHLQPVGPEDHW